jgi:hypothetical protein
MIVTNAPAYYSTVKMALKKEVKNVIGLNLQQDVKIFLFILIEKVKKLNVNSLNKLTEVSSECGVTSRSVLRLLVENHLADTTFVRQRWFRQSMVVQ